MSNQYAPNQCLLSLLSLLILPCLLVAQIPNGSFEEWQLSSEGFEEPVGWSTNNTIFDNEDYISVFRDTIAYHGSYSVGLKANYPTIEGLCPGGASIFLKNTDFATFPTTIEAWVKCDVPDLNNRGICKISINYYKNNEITEGPKWQSRETIDEFTKIEIPLTPQPFDSIIIYLQGGSLITPTGCQGKATMWVDMIDFNYLTSIKEQTDDEQVIIYPNPVKDNLQVQSSDNTNFTQYELYDLAGQLIARQLISEQKQISIPLRFLPKGIFILGLTDSNHRQYLRKLVKH